MAALPALSGPWYFGLPEQCCFHSDLLKTIPFPGQSVILHIEIPPDADEFEAKRNEKEEREGDGSAEMLDLGDDRVLSRNAMRYCK